VHNFETPSRFLGLWFEIIHSRFIEINITLSSVSNPAIIRRRVVLPQPDGPRNTTNSPSEIDREILSNIILSFVKDFEISFSTSFKFLISFVRNSFQKPFRCRFAFQIMVEKFLHLNCVIYFIIILSYDVRFIFIFEHINFLS